jgi:PEP-CTERM motif
MQVLHDKAIAVRNPAASRQGARSLGVALVVGGLCLAVMPRAEAFTLQAGNGLGATYGAGVVVNDPAALPLTQGWLTTNGPLAPYIPLSDAQFIMTTTGTVNYGKLDNPLFVNFESNTPTSVQTFLGGAPVTAFGNFNPTAPGGINNTFFQFQGVVGLSSAFNLFSIAHDDGFDLRLFAIPGIPGGLVQVLGMLESNPSAFNSPDIGPFTDTTAFGPVGCSVDSHVEACYQHFGASNAVGSYLFVMSYLAGPGQSSRLHAEVPEPASLTLLGAGLLGLFGLRRSKAGLDA